MSGFSVPLARQELLHHVLQVGGSAVCGLIRPETSMQANFEVELTTDLAIIHVDADGRKGTVKLRRNDRANHLHLRDFIHEIANSPAPE